MRTGTVPFITRANFQQFLKKVFSRDSFSWSKKEQLSDASDRGKPVIGKITWLICLPRIRQGPGRLFLLLLIAAQE
jgi:hypothetical protein